MLITFQTDAYANITMFGDVALKFLKYMGHSGTVPGAIKAKDIPEALAKLTRAVSAEVKAAGDTPDAEMDEDEAENYVSIDKRAKPLIELLEAAVAQNEDVMWDK